MARKFLTSIDLNKNEIQNVVIHVLATAPTVPAEGMIYYNSTNQRMMLRQASQWIDISGRLDDVLSGHASIVVVDNGDGTVSIQVLNATQSTAGFLSPADKILLDSATSAADPDALALRDSNGDIIFENLVVNGQVTLPNAPVAATDAANKQYVDNAVTAGLQFLGTIDCSVDPDYPAAVAGDAYIAQPGGKIGGVAGTNVNQGDWIICTTDNPGGDEATVGTNWSIVETNVQDATETVSGKVRVATSAEVTAGILDGALSVSPKKLQDKLDALPLGASSYSLDIGDGSNIAYNIPHNLDKVDIQMQLRELATGKVVEPDFTVSDSNNVIVEFNVAPTANQFRVVILG